MIAADLVGQVLAAGGRIAADGPDLVLTAPRPLPHELLTQIKAHKSELLVALARPDPLPHVVEVRRRKVLAMARDGRQYAVYVEDPHTDPVIAALATPAATGELLIPRDRYDPLALLATMEGWEA